jgi:hypothetical protein
MNEGHPLQTSIAAALAALMVVADSLLDLDRQHL